jgi:hypothetical protein
MLGGTMAAVCRKEGDALPKAFDRFEEFLRCPDCDGALSRTSVDALHCNSCAYEAALEGGVYNLLKSADKNELYPGDREDIIDFSLPSHESQLIGEWYDLEGVFGNKYRWIGAKAEAKLKRVKSGPQRLRIRGFAVEQNLPVQMAARMNGEEVGRWTQDRPGLFILETDVPDASEYHLEFTAGPTWSVPTDDRVFTVNLSMIRLVPRD